MIQRSQSEAAIATGLNEFPVTILLGPRQCGKTTLARDFAATHTGETTFWDLENPNDRARLASPMLALERLRGLVVLDEVQRMPELFEVLRVLADRRPINTRFLLLGSASPNIVKSVSETLAGRACFVDMRGFSLDEVAPENWETLWLRGGFPDSFLARSGDASMRWRNNFVRTFLERDMPALGTRTAAEESRRLWTMLAHCHGQLLNVASLAGSLGVSAYAIRQQLDLFTGAFMLRQLPPWFENAGKRVVKSPKVYLRDSGILHNLLGIPTEDALLGHPILGASWEGFAMEETLSALGNPEAWHWRTQAGAELDLLVLRNGKRLGFEFKHTSAPRTSRSMHSALEDLKLEKLFVVYPGTDRFPLTEKIEALGITRLAEISV
ncbi:ATP-binding protein [Geminisphaera colitermitum]|uniref:ATP-binding protein n=1 Tax=Geminisphaera colitermitum TaxID=1148786 RepID=UPI0001964FFE|nr:ATP-binding protein [Geminisphaera colitermitum]